MTWQPEIEAEYEAWVARRVSPAITARRCMLDDRRSFEARCAEVAAVNARIRRCA